MSNTLAPSTTVPIRQKIIDLAKQLESAGSHYLLGAGGDAPMTNINGVPYVQTWKDKRGQVQQGLNRGTSTDMVPPNKDINHLAIKAAVCAATNYVCPGRYGNPNVKGVLVDPDKPSSDDYKELKEYLDKLDSDPGKWPSNTWGAQGQAVYPRKIVGAGVYNANYSQVITGKIVWGEDCSSKQHFDCVYFCMYCYNSIVPSTRWWMEIKGWATNDTISDPIPPGTALLPADILIKNPDSSPYNHIGMYDGANGVVQAEMAATGVITRKYAKDDWQIFRRVKDQFLQQ